MRYPSFVNLAEDTRYRLGVTSRILAAVLGGYALSAAIAALLALVWPLPRADAVLASTMLSFTVYTLIIIWVFSTRSASRAWLGMIVPLVLVSAVVWLLKQGAGA